MGLFRRNNQYDRTRFIRQAREEIRLRRYRRALPLLRQLLVREPNNPDLHLLIAPTLAERGFAFEAWESYKIAAQELCGMGEKQRAADVYADATLRIPRSFEAWVARAALERELGRSDTALTILLAGREHFRGRHRRPQAIALLRRALEIDSKSQATTLDLARLLSRAGQKDEALYHLERLAQRSRGADLKAVAKARWSVLPSIANTWHWMRAG